MVRGGLRRKGLCERVKNIEKDWAAFMAAFAASTWNTLCDVFGQAWSIEQMCEKRYSADEKKKYTILFNTHWRYGLVWWCCSQHNAPLAVSMGRDLLLFSISCVCVCDNVIAGHTAEDSIWSSWTALNSHGGLVWRARVWSIYRWRCRHDVIIIIGHTHAPCVCLRSAGEKGAMTERLALEPIRTDRPTICCDL